MQAAEPGPFALPELDRLFEPYLCAPGLLVGVSGGSDSMALIDLVATWRKRFVDGPTITAATVDHGLRPKSLSEAEAVAAFCASHDIPHHILRWKGNKPTSGLPAAAREARYGLLMGLLEERPGYVLLTAHTLEDQAETFLMRLARGSGLRGLSSMRERSERGGVTIARPLLAIRRERLREHLRCRGIAWFDDPSNSDERFLRPRLRRLLTALADEGLTVERLGDVARKLARADEAIAAALDQLLARETSDGRIERSVYRDCPAEIRLRYLARRIGAVGGGALPPADRSLDAIDHALCSPGAAKVRVTLQHAIISAGPRYLRFEAEKKKRRGIRQNRSRPLENPLDHLMLSKTNV